jgi:hypothetical protein
MEDGFVGRYVSSSQRGLLKGVSQNQNDRIFSLPSQSGHPELVDAENTSYGVKRNNIGPLSVLGAEGRKNEACWDLDFIAWLGSYSGRLVLTMFGLT